MAVLPIALSVASLGFKVGGDIMAGQSKAAADEFKAQQLQTQAEYGQVKANQTSTQMQQQLSDILGNISAVRAAANVDPNSPTSDALLARNEAKGEQQRQIAVNNVNAQVAADQQGADFYKNAAGSETLGGFLGAGGDVLSSLASLHLGGGGG